MSAQQTRSTRQRTAIVDAIERLHNHPTADQVFFEVRKALPSISLGTVYRNLNLLVGQGVIAEISTAENVRRYDANVDLHGHIVCTTCGAIYDITPPLEATREIVAAAESASGYEIDRRRMEFHGFCPACRKAREKRS